MIDQPQIDQQIDNLDTEASDRDQVELNLPQQSNPDWYIMHMVRPEYPLNAPLHERKTPVIFVKVAVFLDLDGKVSASMVTATNGSQIFTDAVLAAVDQWEFAWRISPTAGRWVEMTWNFRSPFYTQNSRRSGFLNGRRPNSPGIHSRSEIEGIFLGMRIELRAVRSGGAGQGPCLDEYLTGEGNIPAT